MIVEIIRLETSKGGTIGVMKINKKVFCYVLEPSDRENERNISSIPTGQYTCKPYASTNHGSTWMVTDVYRRSGIIFHPGNHVGNTQGCFLLGSSVGKLRNNRAVLNSGATFETLKAMMSRETEFHLTISEVY
jgi:hypothetical protein